MSPRVPTYQRQVATAPLPNARVLTDAPANTFGGPVDIAPAAGIVAQKVEEDALDADEMVVNAKERELEDFRIDTLQNPEHGALNRHGINALGAMTDAQEAWRKKVSDINATFTNKRQQKAFERLERGRYSQLVEQIAAHTSAEVRKADEATVYSFLDDGLATVHASPEKAAAMVTDARTRLVEFGRRNGWSTETRKVQAAKHVSDIHVAVISSLAHRGTTDSAAQADAYLKANRSELLGGQLDDAEKLVDSALGQSAGLSEADAILGINQQTTQLPSKGQQEGTVTPGNINLTNRPHVKNADGSVSTVRSISIEEVGKTVLIPTVVGDKVVSNADAIAHYKATGEHLGIFKDEKAATAYAQQLHESQAAGLEQGPASTREEALRRAESIANPKAREAATEAIVRHFTRLETMQRLDRQDAEVTVLRQLEASGGLLNRASAAYQKIVGHPEEERVLHRQDQILRPPKDPGDPELFLSHLNMASLSPQTRAEFARMDFTGKDGQGLNTSQKTHLIQLQRSYRDADTRSNTSERNRAISAAESEAKRYRHAAETAAAKGDKEAERTAMDRQHTAEQTLQKLKGNPLADPSTIPFKDFGSAGKTPSGPATGNPLAGMLTPRFEATPQMIEDAARNPRYADYLRSVGVALPAVLPTVRQ